MMRVELTRIQKETRIPILYVTHDQVEALAMSDRIAVMSEGRHSSAGLAHGNLPAAGDPVRPRFIGTVNYIACRLVDAEEKTRAP